MIDAKEKTLRDFVHEAIVPLIEDVLVKKLYQALEVVVSEIKPPRKEWQAVNGKLEVEPIKGTLLPQAQRQEPVAWMRNNDVPNDTKWGMYSSMQKFPSDIPLYTSPPRKEYICTKCGETNDN